LPRLEMYAYALLRMVFGFLFLFHGLQKMFGWFGGRQVSLLSLGGFAGLIETIGGPLIAVGLWTGPTAFLCSGEMAVAYFLRHQPRATWPIQNGGEAAALFCFAFLFIAMRGGGRLSLDALRGRKVR
jgi:putative oxidoreductase